MNTKEVAKEIVKDFGTFKGEIESYGKEGKGLFAKIVKAYADQILAFANEGEFLHLLADLSDELYQGNFFTEQIDGAVFYQGFKYLDKLALDKIFGEDWFIKLQEFAKKVK